MSFPDTNVDLRPIGIEAQLRALFNRELPLEVRRISRAVLKRPTAQRVKVRLSWRLKGRPIFDFEIDEKA